MPLLRKKIFEKQTVPDYLRDDEEVFYCEITNEIFRDYHDFSERMFLCNSMVWTCSMTGKSNLTYQEAVESEEHARQCLKEFPTELKLPILYLATLTKRTFFGEMAEDIFCYAKDRYFVGENVEACFTANKWKDCHIISVIAPEEEQYKHEIKNSGNHSPSERHFIPSASLYKYEIEHLDADDNDISEIMIVDSTQLRRKKVHFSRDKSKLFLKQHVEQDSRGIFIIKSTDLERFNIKNVRWETIFDGPLPNFQSSKNFEKAVNGKKRQKQETLSKYLEKNGLVMKKEGQANKEKKNNNLLEQMKKREEEFKKQKQLNDEQKALERQRKKEESMKIAQYFKEWSKTKEDLELEDQAKLPVPAPVKCKVSDKYFGDMLAILEFVHNFPKLLSTKDFFPGGISLEIIERALTEKEVAGPLTDLIQMLLVAIFNCQEEESNNYNTGVETLKEINKEKLSTTPSVEEGTHLATLASKWPVKYQGLPLSRLPLYSLTVSEILRLHLLSSGARIKEAGTRWRYGLRGGYTCEDDPGLYLRLNQAHILKALAIHNVVQLSIDDKIQTISCLMNQILTYADVRDIIEDKIEKVRQAKLELKTTRIADRKREMEYVSQKFKLKKELKEDVSGLQAALDALEIENGKKQATNQKKIEKFLKTANEGQTLLGRDRAYRKYLKIESVPGIFVNWEDEHAGTCLDKVTVQYPELANADRQQLMDHIKTLHLNNVKKENSPSKSPSKSPRKVNGIRKSLSAAETETCTELLLCTANQINCPVHGETSNRPKWSFFYEKEQLQELIKTLNKRGYREGELKDFVKCDEEKLVSLIAKTPVTLLNSEIEVKVDETEERPVRANGSAKKKDRYEDANLGYPPEMKSEEVLENALIENILEMEEKITGGALGNLKIKDRDRWRNCLQNKDYSELEKIHKLTLNSNKENKHLKVKKSEKGRSRSSTPEIPDKDKKEEKEYEDPGKFLGATLNVIPEDSEDDTDCTVLPLSDTTKIQCLATALCHTAQAVDAKYLKRPLGHADVRPSNKHKDEYDVLERWEQSLLASTSFSQIFLHYGTLDSCVMWSRSALLARCQICRRQKDSENMLLCDSCNLGHHMYCLKPKLTAVPKGDWFCDKCKKEKEKQEKLLSPEPVKKRRRIFVEEEVDEEEEQDSGNEEGGDEEESNEEEEMSDDDDDDEESDIKLEVCKTCGSGGETVECDKCHSSFHKECITPPLRRLPRSPWTCPSCSNRGKHDSRSRERVKENGYDTENGSGAVKFAGLTFSHRLCAAKANRKIYDFTRAMRNCDSKLNSSDDDDEYDHFSDEDDDDDDDDDYDSGSSAVKFAGLTYSHRRCAAKANRKIHDFTRALRISNSKLHSSDDDDDDYDYDDSDDSEEVVHRRSLRRDEKRDDLPLHNAALQELLSDVMKHEAAWPFLRPVQLKEVPDYHKIISEPMDFGTIKYKLNMGKYSTDSQLMRDVVLVFDNCSTYNSSEDEVYKLGVILLAYFSKKAKELGLTVPPELEQEEEEGEIPAPKAKKRRTK